MTTTATRKGTSETSRCGPSVTSSPAKMLNRNYSRNGCRHSSCTFVSKIHQPIPTNVCSQSYLCNILLMFFLNYIFICLWCMMFHILAIKRGNSYFNLFYNKMLDVWFETAVTHYCFSTSLRLSSNQYSNNPTPPHSHLDGFYWGHQYLWTLTQAYIMQVSNMESVNCSRKQPGLCQGLNLYLPINQLDRIICS